MRLGSLLLAFFIVLMVAYAGQDRTDERLVALPDGTTASVIMTPEEADLCLPKPNLMGRLTQGASDLGGIVTVLNGPIPLDQIAENIRGAWWTAGFLGGTAAASADGRPVADEAVTVVDCAALLNPCVTADSNSGTPYNPKSASLTGPALAADALTAAAPHDRKWLSRIPLGVAMAEHESSFDPTASNDVNTGHVGLWQISGANAARLKLGDREDPYDNAEYAYAIWKGRGGTWSMDWTPYEEALADQDKYAKYGDAPTVPLVAAAAAGVAPADPADPPPALRQDPKTFTPDPKCSTSGSLGGVTVGTWNTAGKIGNAPAQINKAAPFADVVGLQEIRDNDRLRPRGYGVTPGNMAVPIIWNRSKVDLVQWRREDSLNGYAKDKSVVWAIFQVNGTTARFAVVNTHQLVQGGKGWRVQAAKVKAVVKRLQGKGLPVVLVGDMNARQDEVAATFGKAGVGGSIDRIIGFGAEVTDPAELSFAGSDHHRRRAMLTAPAATAPGDVIDPGGREYNLGPVTPQASKVAHLLGHRFDLKVIGGYRANDPYPDHPSGRALDLMVYGDQEKGQAMADYAQANAEALRVDYMIWNQSIWSVARASEGWRPMADRGSTSANHKDHVHLMVKKS